LNLYSTSKDTGSSSKKVQRPVAQYTLGYTPDMDPWCHSVIQSKSWMSLKCTSSIKILQNSPQGSNMFFSMPIKHTFLYNPKILHISANFLQHFHLKNLFLFILTKYMCILPLHYVVITLIIIFSQLCNFWVKINTMKLLLWHFMRSVNTSCTTMYSASTIKYLVHVSVNVITGIKDTQSCSISLRFLSFFLLFIILPFSKVSKQ